MLSNKSYLATSKVFKKTLLMRYLLSILFLFSFKFTFAQLVITIDKIPQIGSKWVLFNSNDTSAKNYQLNTTGTNNTWDFTPFPVSSIDTLMFGSADTAAGYQLHKCKIRY